MPVVTEKIAMMLLLLSLQSPGYANGLELSVKPMNRTAWPKTIEQSFEIVETNISKLEQHFQENDNTPDVVAARNLVVALRYMEPLLRLKKNKELLSSFNYPRTKVLAVDLVGLMQKKQHEEARQKFIKLKKEFNKESS